MMRSRLVVLTVFALGLTLAAGSPARAKDAKKTKAPVAKSASPGPPGVTLNACGCYSRGNGCACTNKKAKCECPGDCEPVGCAEKRDKEMEKETADAIRRAQDDDKKREEAEAKRAEDEEKRLQAASQAEGEGETENQANPPNEPEKSKPGQSAPKSGGKK